MQKPQTQSPPHIPADGVLVVASHNAGKLREIAEILAPHAPRLQLKSGKDFNLPIPVEDGDSYEANAAIKAHAAAAATGHIALADDSGFEVAALGGKPGIHAADWAELGDGEARNFTHAMQRVRNAVMASDTPDDRRCRFVSVLVLAFPDGGEVFARGEVRGNMTWPPRGGEGFGYDPIFIPHGHSMTFAEMGGAEKQSISHRRRAFDDLLGRIRIGER